MKFIDTHAHLYAEQFDDDRDQMIRKALEEGIVRMYLPNIDKGSIEVMHELVEQYPEHIFPMMGLHPCSVKEDFEAELTIAEERLSSYKYAAVGEIGLDYYWDKTFKDEQKEALQVQIAWAKQRQLPIILHSRDSFDDLFEIVEEYNDAELKGIFHCFTGSVKEAEKIMSLGGFYMGIGGVVTFKNSGLDKTVENIPLEYLVLETDAPYLAPAPFRGKRNESAFIRLIAEKLAEVKKVNIEEIAEVTTANALQLFAK